MKRKVMAALSVPLCAAMLLMSSCAGGSTLLRAAAEPEDFSYTERQDEDFIAVQQGAEDFAARFASAALYEAASEGTENAVVSPISVYMGLSLAAASSAGETKEELLSALGVTEETLGEGISILWRSLNRELGKTGKIALSNGIWLDASTPFVEETLDVLAEDYYCNSYSADFAGDNDAANRALSKYIKDETNGLIDAELALSPETVFALVNTLYLKDTWNEYGDDIARTEERTFTQGSGEEVLRRLLQGDYGMGRAFEGENYTSYHTSTLHGFRITFLVPKDGVSLSEVMTAQNIAEVSSKEDWNATDEENHIRYYTRCLFPEFEGDYAGDVSPVLKAEFGIEKLFDRKQSDLSALTGKTSGVYCTEAQHIAKLKVDRKGIEGAAVFVLPGAGEAGPDEYEQVYEDFLVDRAFGFVLTDSYNTTLFAGVIHEV
ncbi:MAG TPA: hypothetical protein H9797_03110 [Candidatus Gallimonas gallistercoris]|uniref:Serpin domain-containing protein n=1 Tax=Candidatus Gallimonas gallistercoris TaxID=2838602 RepID=A0A9D2H0G3_9FIRM|nr:hypothetical protein [Candidatus Gallimonas gallistercoris]